MCQANKEMGGHIARVTRKWPMADRYFHPCYMPPQCCNRIIMYNYSSLVSVSSSRAILGLKQIFVNIHIRGYLNTILSIQIIILFISK